MNILQRTAPNGRTASIETIELSPKRKRRPRWLVALVLVALVAIVVASVLYVRGRSTNVLAYTTVPVVRQDLVQAVTATGTVNPQNTVTVGTQESGTVAEIDVDFNSHVKKGQVLAKLDPTTFEAAAAQAQAGLAQAQAQADAARATAAGAQSSIGAADATQRAAEATARAASDSARSSGAAVATANANVTKAQSALALAQQTVSRDTQLIASGYIAQSQLDLDRSGAVAAQAALAGSVAAAQQAVLGASAGADQAQASQAQTSAQGYSATTAQSQAVTQAANATAARAAVGTFQAQLRQAQLNISKTIITSPVDGTVVSRSVSVGTTVAASLQTPTLFSIAQDLNKMEVDVSVGEPDIGNVRKGDGVDFTVLAYPAQTFHGAVSQVRINPTTTNNVVTYTTVVLVDNRAGKLLPGMTANASIHVAKALNALVVPVVALAYRPASEASANHRGSGNQGSGGNGAGAAGGASRAVAPTSGPASPWGATNGNASALASAGGRSRIFVQRRSALQRVPVEVLLISGTQAAVRPLRGALSTSDAVVTGDAQPDAMQGRATRSAGNPLTTIGGPGGGAARGLR